MVASWRRAAPATSWNSGRLDVRASVSNSSESEPASANEIAPPTVPLQPVVRSTSLSGRQPRPQRL
eukprot:6525563-Prymnesium_polylepis.1